MKEILKNLVNAVVYGHQYGPPLEKAKNVLSLFDKRIKRLDHGHIGLVDFMGADLSISRNARVSYDAEWRAGEDKNSDTKLINYLYSNGHSTPFESVCFTFDVKAPIFVISQWQAYSELSARYRELPEEFYIPHARLIGTQSKGNKQCRDILTEEEYNTLSAEEHSRIAHIQADMYEQDAQAFETYKALLAQEVPRELARSVLPVGTYSHMFTTVNLNNLFKFLGERLHTHAQFEIRVYAEAILELIEPIVPVAVEAFKKSLGEGYEL